MSDARYAPPRARLRAAAAAGRGGTLDPGEALKEAWAATWSSFGLILAVYGVGALLTLLSMFTFVGIILLVPVFVWGFLRFNLNAVDGRAEFADLFSGFGDYARVVGTMLVLTGLMILVGMLGLSVSIAGSLMDSGALWGLGLLVNFVWMLTVMPRLAFAWYYAVDRELGPSEALAAAWEATAGQTGYCLLIPLLSSVVMLMGFLSLLVGLIPAVMIAYLMKAAAFRQLAGRQTDAA